MSQEPSSAFFNEEMAATYDERFARLAPLKDALHLGMRMVMDGLPRQARVLCVGAGTGAEVLTLGEANPEWHFTLVEPSGAMLAVARRRCEAAGLLSRCSFHEGFLESLPPAPEFDAATAILVSQFLVDPQDRLSFFRRIAERLVSGGLFVSADLSADGEVKARILSIWLKLIEYNGASTEQLEGYLEAIGKNLAVSDTSEVETLITSAGFESPVRFMQTLLIQAWATKRS